MGGREKAGRILYVRKWGEVVVGFVSVFICLWRRFLSVELERKRILWVCRLLGDD